MGIDRIFTIVQYIARKYNYLKKLARFYLRKPRIPERLYVEITNICNSNCVFCGRQHDSRERNIIDDEVFRKAVDEYKKMGGENIGFTPPGGEVFVDPKIIEKFEYVREKCFQQVTLYTNMTLLHKFGMERFLKSGITGLYISVAPLIEEIYTKIYRTNNYTAVLRNLMDLLTAFKSTDDKTINKISIEFRSDRPFEECISTTDYKKYVKPFLSKNVSVGAMSSYDSWNGAIKETDLLEGMKIKTPNFSKKVPCSRLFTVQIMVDGTIRLCGCRYDPFLIGDELVIGNVKNESIYDAYNSRKVEIIMNSFFGNEPPEVCRKCSWFEWD